jgi:hypothetical protein
VSVALAEYGSTTVSTARLRGTAFVEIDPIQGNVVGYNAGVSIDEVAKNIAAGGTNIDYATGTGVQPVSIPRPSTRSRPRPRSCRPTSGSRRPACAGPTCRRSVGCTSPTSTPTCSTT